MNIRVWWSFTRRSVADGSNNRIAWQVRAIKRSLYRSELSLARAPAGEALRRVVESHVRDSSEADGFGETNLAVEDSMARIPTATIGAATGSPMVSGQSSYPARRTTGIALRRHWFWGSEYRTVGYGAGVEPTRPAVRSR